MQTLLARQTVSMTQLREPAKVFGQAGNQPVAILNRNQIAGYFVPVTAVEKLRFEAAAPIEVQTALTQRLPALRETLNWLEDK